MPVRAVPRAVPKALAEVFGLVTAVAAFGSVGCQSHDTAPPPPDAPHERAINPDPRNASRRLAFGDLPAPVRDAFRQEHPRADVTDAGVQTTRPGTVFYSVVYKQDGIVGEAGYREDGSRVDAAAATVLTHPPVTPVAPPPAVVVPPPPPPAVPPAVTAPPATVPPATVPPPPADVAPNPGTGTPAPSRAGGPAARTGTPATDTPLPPVPPPTTLPAPTVRDRKPS